MRKKMGNIFIANPFMHAWNHLYAAKYGPRGPPRAIYEPGGQGVAETPIASKGLTSHVNI